MKRLISAAMLVAATALTSLTASQASAERNDCFVGCNVMAHGCVADLRSERNACKETCHGTAPGPGRGECMRNCAHVPMPAKQECKIERDACRGECDHPNSCSFACGAVARECFTGARSTARDCRMDCRTAAEEQAAACAMAADPAACLEAVAEARGACLDVCGTEQDEALGDCGTAVAACKSACHPPDGNEPPEAP
jgi:hypothetical protein